MPELRLSRFASLLNAKFLFPLVALCFAVSLAFAPLTFTSSTAHAATASPASDNNACSPYDYACVTVWATNVNVRDCTQGGDVTYPSTACLVVDRLAGGGESVGAVCQQAGQTITYDGYSSNYWTQLVGDNGIAGFTSNVFLVGGVTISGVPFCNYRS